MAEFSIPTMSLEAGALRFGPQFDVAVRSCTGVGPSQRVENQDNYLLIDIDGNASYLQEQQPRRQRVPGWTAGHARVAVLDGMGGHGHGREAAEAAVAGLMAIPPCTTLTELARHLDALHARLQHHFAAIERSPLRPGTTLTMLELPPGGTALLYHVGDSRLYEISSRAASVLTVDHVPATTFAMAGLLDEGEWWQQVHGEHRPEISQAFILGNAFANPALLDDALRELTPVMLPPWLGKLHDRRAIALRPGSAYLLATDGFWSCSRAREWVARWPALFAKCSTAAEMVEALFDEIESHPPPGLHSDNLTALVLRPLGAGDETALPAH
jgi:serine/threonine protein phosphatase PrpC